MVAEDLGGCPFTFIFGGHIATIFRLQTFMLLVRTMYMCNKLVINCTLDKLYKSIPNSLFSVVASPN